MNLQDDVTDREKNSTYLGKFYITVRTAVEMLKEPDKKDAHKGRSDRDCKLCLESLSGFVRRLPCVRLYHARRYLDS